MTFLGLMLALLATMAVAKESLAGESLYGRASKHGHIGETGTLHQTSDGYFFHPFYNDFFGGTDKHLTNMFLIGGLWSKAEKSLELTLNWRFITPDTRVAFNSNEMEKRDGVFSDWISVDSAYRQSLNFDDGGWFTQFDFGLGRIGNHGAKNVQVMFHKTLRNKYSNLYYDAPLEGTTLSGGAQFGKQINNSVIESQWLLGGHQNVFMQEIYFQATASVNVGSKARLGIDARLIKQTKSEVYAPFGLRSYRREIAFGLSTDDRWRPSLKFVSPFIDRDQTWQVYLDLLSWDMPRH